MTWIRRTLRGTEVYARAKADGSLDVGADGRVDVKYKLDEGAKVYRAAERNLEPAGSDDGGEPIIIYTDGACTGNPGPMGIGVVILRGKERSEISEFLGSGTNNIAELTAIERALDALGPEDRGRPLLVHVDSAYAIGVASGAYKARKNVELVAEIRRKASAFPRLRFVKVAGHAGVAENERCDRLANDAVHRGTRTSSARAR
jgi:ribonuclease HI